LDANLPSFSSLAGKWHLKQIFGGTKHFQLKRKNMVKPLNPLPPHRGTRSISYKRWRRLME
jgi:hypothetical protein